MVWSCPRISNTRPGSNYGAVLLSTSVGGGWRGASIIATQKYALRTHADEGGEALSRRLLLFLLLGPYLASVGSGGWGCVCYCRTGVQVDGSCWMKREGGDICCWGPSLWSLVCVCRRGG
jgi:hypothetical protein